MGKLFLLVKTGLSESLLITLRPICDASCTVRSPPGVIQRWSPCMEWAQTGQSFGSGAAIGNVAWCCQSTVGHLPTIMVSLRTPHGNGWCSAMTVQCPPRSLEVLTLGQNLGVFSVTLDSIKNRKTILFCQCRGVGWTPTLIISHWPNRHFVMVACKCGIGASWKESICARLMSSQLLSS